MCRVGWNIEKSNIPFSSCLFCFLMAFEHKRWISGSCLELFSDYQGCNTVPELWVIFQALPWESVPRVQNLLWWRTESRISPWQGWEEGQIRLGRGGQGFRLITLAFLFGKLQSIDIKISSLLIKSFHITGVKNFNEHHGTLVAELMTKRGGLGLQAYLPLGISELAGGANWQESLWKWLSFSSSLCYFN